MPLLNQAQAAYLGRLRFLLLADAGHAAERAAAGKKLTRGGQLTLGFEAEDDALPEPPDPPGDDTEAAELLTEYELDSLRLHLSFHPCLTPEGIALARLARYSPQAVAAAARGQAGWVTAAVHADAVRGRSDKYARGTLETPSGGTPCVFRAPCTDAALDAPRGKPLACLCSPLGDGMGVAVGELVEFKQAAPRLTAAVLVKVPQGGGLEAVADCLKGAAWLGAGRKAALFLQDASGGQHRVGGGWVACDALGKGLGPLRALWGNEAVELWGKLVPLRQSEGGANRNARVHFATSSRSTKG